MAKRSPVSAPSAKKASGKASKTRKKTSKKSAAGRSKKPKSKPKVKLKKDLLKDYRQRMQKAGVTNVATIADGKSTVRRSISTQSIALDAKLGGGIPLGKIIEVVGPPHVGKSTFLDHCFAQVQKEDGLAVLADTEYSRDSKYSARIGVDVKEIIYLEWDDTEQYIENVVNAVYETVVFWRKEAPDMPVIIGWDALGSTASADDIKKGLGAKATKGKDGEEVKKRAAKPGAAAKAMSMAMRQIAPAIAGTNIAFIILNHEYEVVNTGRGAGPKRKAYGGKGVPHAASLRFTMWPVERIKDNQGVIIGSKVVVTFQKDRIYGQTNKTANLAVLTGIGIDNVYSLLHDLKNCGVIVTNGGWSAMNLDGEDIKWQGIDGANGFRAKCQDDETLFSRMVSVYMGLMRPKEVESL